MMTPLDYARAACDTLMRKYDAQDLPPKPQFHYHQGVFLSGMHETWKLCGEEKYFEYMKAWIDSVFNPDGSIVYCHFANLDDIMPGILLFRILDRTGDKFYETCLASVWEEVEAIPTNPEGGFWHGTECTNQMWLDGLYMSGPFIAEYAKRFDKPEWAKKIVANALMMRNKTHDPYTGLMYHAWDGQREKPWADKFHGRAPEFWGRSMGWVPVALLNDLDHLPEDIVGREEVLHMCTDLLKALCRYQSEEGRWYQVVNKGDQEGNWLENSCSCLYVAALCKAMRLGYMGEEYADAARRGYEAVINSLEWKDEDLQIGNVCIGTGVGDYAFYCARPTSVNDLHGAGAFLLMCTEMQKWLDSRK